MKTVLCFLLFLTANISYAGQWVPVIQPPEMKIVKFSVTTQVEKRYMFRTVTEVKMVPVTRWVYQPYYVIE